MKNKKAIKQQIVKELSTVIDPELGIDIVNLGLVYSIDLDEDGICLIEMLLPTLGCPLANTLTTLVITAVKKVPEVHNVDVEFILKPAWTVDRMSRAARIALGVH